MDIIQLDKIKGFSNWMDRKPRAWLLFILSAGIGFFGYGYVHRGQDLEKCQNEKSQVQDNMNSMLYDLLQESRGIHEAQKTQADSAETVLDKAKKVVKEVKNKI